MFTKKEIVDFLIAASFFGIGFISIPQIIRENPHLWVNFNQFLGNGSNKWAYFLGTHIVHAVLFITLNSCMAILYYINNANVEKFKTEPEPWAWRSNNPQEVTKFWKLFWKTLGLVLFNNIAVAVPLSWLSYDSVARLGVFDPRMETFPSTSTILLHVGACLLVEDFLFYWSHRLLHIPYLFKQIHKVHHQHHAPIGIASEYAHPVEYYLGNLMPTGIGPVLMKTHLFTYYIWIGVRLAKTLEAHCGYSFPFSPFQYLPFANPASAHDYHHSRGITTCYGSFLRVWDTIQGTNRDFLAGNKTQKIQSQE